MSKLDSFGISAFIHLLPGRSPLLSYARVMAISLSVSDSQTLSARRSESEATFVD